MVSERTRYEPRGAAVDFIRSTRPRIVMTGPAGCGKSRASLEKLNQMLLDNPGALALVVRSERASLEQTTCITYERDVMPAGVERTHGDCYEYPNGSKIILGGMDQLLKLISTDFDVIYAAEIQEMTSEDCEMLFTRLRGTKIPYKQVIADATPPEDGLTHWLWKAVKSGDYVSYHGSLEVTGEVKLQRIPPPGIPYDATNAQIKESIEAEETPEQLISRLEATVKQLEAELLKANEERDKALITNDAPEDTKNLREQNKALGQELKSVREENEILKGQMSAGTSPMVLGRPEGCELLQEFAPQPNDPDNPRPLNQWVAKAPGYFEYHMSFKNDSGYDTNIPGRIKGMALKCMGEHHGSPPMELGEMVNGVFTYTKLPKFSPENRIVLTLQIVGA